MKFKSVTSTLFFFILTDISFCSSQTLIVRGGTTILSVIAKDSIIIAADSKHVTKNTFIANKVSTECKIRHTNNLFYAFSGLTDMTYGNQVVFNCFDIIHRIALKNTSINKKIESFDFDIKTDFEKTSKIVDTLFLHSYINKPFIEVIIVGFENNIPVYKTGIYFLRRKNIRDFQLKYKDYTLSDLPYLSMFGFHKNIDTYLYSNRLFFSSYDNIPNKLNFLIQLEVQNNSTNVSAQGMDMCGYKRNKNAINYLTVSIAFTPVDFSLKKHGHSLRLSNEIDTFCLSVRTFLLFNL